MAKHLIRTDLIRKQKNDFGYQPNGIVLIDEPETHLHISMQYNILPLISRLFPNIQFIVATHSPAIISSLENSIVYDLTSKTEVADWILGSSFSELMIRHFGLENEYSPVADRILEEVNEAARKNDVTALKSILEKNEAFLTPALKLDIESLLITHFTFIIISISILKTYIINKCSNKYKILKIVKYFII